MRPDMVVEEAELCECVIERLEGCHRELVETGFERTKETFHPSVLPRAMQIGSLMADTQQRKRKLNTREVKIDSLSVLIILGLP